MEMLDFDGKQEVMSRIAANGTMYQLLMERTQQAMALAQLAGGPEGQAIAQQIAQETATMQSMIPNAAPTVQQGESSVTKNARQRVAESTSPT
jgi:hypothetical protein